MMRANGKQLFGIILLLAGSRVVAAEPHDTSAVIRTNLGPSPVQEFRQLLVMSPDELAMQLTLRPPGLREPTEAKVKEYLALPTEEREVRLQATELRHYLSILLPLLPTNRDLLVAQIAEPMRSVVGARLETWSIMPPPMQQELIENDRVINYFTQLGAMTAAQRKEMIAALPAEERVKLERDIARWRALPGEARNRSFAQFNQLFNLTAEEREKALRYLSDAEREAMRATLDTFAELTPEQRQTCIQSFEKFANLSLAERQEFLKKAEAWRRMSPAEREQWREVVRLVPQLPPLPPGFVPAVATSPVHTTARTNSAPVGKTINGG